MLNISTASLQYVPVQVTALKEGLPYNPTSDTVQMAFSLGVATATPANLTFNPAIWDTASNAYYALCLVGPGGSISLASGIWTVWVQVSDNPEIPVLNCGQIQVT